MATGVRFFRSTDTGAPALNGNVGSLITVLDGCLINGYNSQTLTSITRSGATATATKISHGFIALQKVRISGADQAEYNGDFYITNVAANTFDFTVSGSPASPATGTITAKVAPLDWTKEFATIANTAVYRPPAGNRFYLNVDDAGTVTNATLSYMRGCEVAYGCNLATAATYLKNPFPNLGATDGTNGLMCFKSNATGATTNRWKIIGNEKIVYMLTDHTGSDTEGTQRFGWFFGDIISWYPGDVYHTAFNGGRNTGQNNVFGTVALFPGTSNNTMYFARDPNGIFKSPNYGLADRWGNTYPFVNTTRQYPNPCNNEMEIDELRCIDTGGPGASIRIQRGKLPGVWSAAYANNVIADLSTFSGTGNLAGKTFIYYAMSGGGIILETSNTWNTN